MEAKGRLPKTRPECVFCTWRRGPGTGAGASGRDWGQQWVVRGGRCPGNPMQTAGTGSEPMQATRWGEEELLPLLCTGCSGSGYMSEGMTAWSRGVAISFLLTQQASDTPRNGPVNTSWGGPGATPRAPWTLPPSWSHCSSQPPSPDRGLLPLIPDPVFCIPLHPQWTSQCYCLEQKSCPKM